METWGGGGGREGSLTNSETDEKKSISTISIRNTEAVAFIQRDGSAISAVVIEAKRFSFLANNHKNH